MTPSLGDLIRSGRAGELSQAEFARGFAETRMLLLLASEPADDDVEPLVLALPSGEPAVAVFAGPDTVDDDYLAVAPHPIALTGKDLLEMLPANVGLALNPGQEDSLQMEPAEVPLFATVALSPQSRESPRDLT